MKRLITIAEQIIYALKYPKALADFSKLLRIDSQYIDAYFNLALSYQAVKEYEKAIRTYTKALSFRPANYIAYQQRGIAYAAVGKTNLAFKDFNKAIELGIEDFTTALEYYDMTAEISARELFDVYVKRAISYGELDEADLAAEDFEKAKSLGWDGTYTVRNLEE